MLTAQAYADIKAYWPKIEGDPQRVLQVCRDLSLSIYDLAAALGRDTQYVREYILNRGLPLGDFDKRNQDSIRQAQKALDTWGLENGVNVPNLSDPNFEGLMISQDPVAAWIRWVVGPRLLAGGNPVAVTYHAREGHGTELNARDARYDPGLTEQQAREATLWSRLTAEAAEANLARFAAQK